MPKKIKSTPKVKSKSKFYIESIKKKPEIIFEAAITPYQELEAEKELEKLRLEDKNTERDMAILAKELEKPASVRNKTITTKYSAKINESYSWPSLEIGKKFTITAFSPDSSEIPLENRPQPWFAKTTFSEFGSDFEYKFPISSFANINGENFYKIDQTNTIVDSNGTIEPNLSDNAITPYLILQKYIAGDTSLAQDYKFTTESGDEFYYFNFPGFLVSAKVKSSSIKEYVKKVPPKTPEVKEKLQKFTVDQTLLNQLPKDKKVLVEGKLALGVDTGAEVIKKDLAVITNFKTAQTSYNWFVFTGENASGDYLEVTYVEGYKKASALINKTVFNSKPAADASIAAWNKKKVAEFLKK